MVAVMPARGRRIARTRSDEPHKGNRRHRPKGVAEASRRTGLYQHAGDSLLGATLGTRP
jgi:hypothetical protein